MKIIFGWLIVTVFSLAFALGLAGVIYAIAGWPGLLSILGIAAITWALSWAIGMLGDL